MKISLINIYETVIYIIVLLNLEILNLTTNLNDFSQRIAIVLSFLLASVYLFQKNKLFPKNFGVYFYIVSISVYLFIELTRLHFSSFSGFNILDGLNYEKSFFYLLLIMPIFEILKSKATIFIRNICYIGLVALILRFFIWLLFNKYGINIMPGLFEIHGYNWTHGGGYVRLQGTFLDGLVFTYFGIKLFKSVLIKDRIRNTVIIGFMFFYSAEVFSSRAQIICYLVVLLVLYIWNSKDKLDAFFKCFLGLVLIMILFNLPMTKKFISSFSVNDPTYGAGSMVRVLGSQLYSNEWHNSSFLFGFGIASDENYFGNIKYYLSDLGIISYLFEFGIVGFILFLFPMLEGILVGIKNTKDDDSLLLFLLSFYTLISSFMSQNVYDYIRILIIPFLLGISLYVKYEQNSLKFKGRTVENEIR